MAGCIALGVKWWFWGQNRGRVVRY